MYEPSSMMCRWSRNRVYTRKNTWTVFKEGVGHTLYIRQFFLSIWIKYTIIVSLVVLVMHLGTFPPTRLLSGIAVKLTFKKNRKYCSLNEHIIQGCPKRWDCKDDLKLLINDDLNVKLILLSFIKSCNSLLNYLAKKK